MEDGRYCDVDPVDGPAGAEVVDGTAAANDDSKALASFAVKPAAGMEGERSANDKPAPVEAEAEAEAEERSAVICPPLCAGKSETLSSPSLWEILLISNGSPSSSSPASSLSSSWFFSPRRRLTGRPFSSLSTPTSISSLFRLRDRRVAPAGPFDDEGVHAAVDAAKALVLVNAGESSAFLPAADDGGNWRERGRKGCTDG